LLKFLLQDWENARQPSSSCFAMTYLYVPTVHQ